MANHSRSESNPKMKLFAFESLRGVAALFVVIYHFLLAFVFRYDYTNQYSATCLRAVRQSGIAVSVFFVLSGFVLSLSFLRNKSHESLTSAAIKRYIRLAIPVAASVALAYVLAISGCLHNDEAGSLMGSSEGSWLRKQVRFEPSLRSAVRDAFWDSFFNHEDEHTYNSSLWTMPIELFGSYFVFATLALVGDLKHRWIIFAILAGVLHRLQLVHTIDFLVGLILCDVYVHYGEKLINRKWIGSLAVVSLLLGLVVHELGEKWGFLYMGPGPGSIFSKLALTGSWLILAGVTFSQDIQRILSSRPLVWLGKISFCLYLVHIPVELSLSSWLYVEGVTHWGLSDSMAVTEAIITGIAVSLLLAWLGAMTVEPLGIRMGTFLYSWLNQSNPTQPAGSITAKVETKSEEKPIPTFFNDAGFESLKGPATQSPSDTHASNTA